MPLSKDPDNWGVKAAQAGMGRAPAGEESLVNGVEADETPPKVEAVVP